MWIHDAINLENQVLYRVNSSVANRTRKDNKNASHIVFTPNIVSVFLLAIAIFFSNFLGQETAFIHFSYRSHVTEEIP